jgi:putative inorganic carbon (HCO3(-)) transporter
VIFYYWLVFVMPRGEDEFWGQHLAGLTLVKYLGIACLLYAVYHLVRNHSLPRYLHTAQAKCVLIFFAIACASYVLRGPGFSWQANLFVSYISFLILFFVTLAVVDTLSRFRWVLIAGVGGIAFASLYMLRQWRWYGYNPLFRPDIGVGNPNDFAAMATLFVPMAFFLALARRPYWERLFFGGCLVLTLGGITVSASRGGFLGLAIALLYMILNSKRRLRNLALAGVLLVPMALAPISPLHRLLHPSSSDQASTQDRKEAWMSGLRMIRAHPFLGVGLGNFKNMSGDYGGPDLNTKELAHNTYIEIAAEMGVPGLFAFLGILYFSFRTLQRIRPSTRRSGLALLHQAALGMQAGLLGCSVAIFFSSLEYIKPFWLVVFLTMCMPSLVAHTRKKQLTPVVIAESEGHEELNAQEAFSTAEANCRHTEQSGERAPNVAFDHV